jgi:phage-related protein
MREIVFFKTRAGKSPVEDYLDTLSEKEVQKVLWVLRLVKELPTVSTEYFKKLQNTDGIWEIRAKQASNAFRLLGFLDQGSLVVLTNGFSKKTQKTPASEIVLAAKRKTEYLSRKNHG